VDSPAIASSLRRSRPNVTAWPPLTSGNVKVVDLLTILGREADTNADTSGRSRRLPRRAAATVPQVRNDPVHRLGRLPVRFLQRVDIDLGSRHPRVPERRLDRLRMQAFLGEVRAARMTEIVDAGTLDPGLRAHLVPRPVDAARLQRCADGRRENQVGVEPSLGPHPRGTLLALVSAQGVDKYVAEREHGGRRVRLHVLGHETALPLSGRRVDVAPDPLNLLRQADRAGIPVDVGPPEARR